MCCSTGHLAHQQWNRTRLNETVNNNETNLLSDQTIGGECLKPDTVHSNEDLNHGISAKRLGPDTFSILWGCT